MTTQTTRTLATTLKKILTFQITTLKTTTTTSKRRQNDGSEVGHERADKQKTKTRNGSQSIFSSEFTVDHDLTDLEQTMLTL